MSSFVHDDLLYMQPLPSTYTVRVATLDIRVAISRTSSRANSVPRRSMRVNEATLDDDLARSNARLRLKRFRAADEGAIG